MNWFDKLMSIITSAIIALTIVCFGLMATGYSAIPAYPSIQAFYWLLLLTVFASAAVFKWVIGE